MLKCMECALDFQIRIYLLTCSVKVKCCSVKRKCYAINVKCGDAKIFGLGLGFWNSNLSSYMPC